MFEKTVIEEKDHLKIKLKGDLDVYSEKEFKDFVNENLVNKDMDFVFDLEELDYIDSTGLGLFMNVYKMQESKSKSVKIINAKDNIYKLFKITDLIDLFKMEQ